MVWVVNVYQIALVATLLPLGALGEIVGHERIDIVIGLSTVGCGCALWWACTTDAGRTTGTPLHDAYAKTMRK